MYLKEAKKALNFNEKKYLNQILLWRNTEAEKFILNSIIAPNKFSALNLMLQLGPKKHYKVKCFNAESQLSTEPSKRALWGSLKDLVALEEYFGM